MDDFAVMNDYLREVLACRGGSAFSYFFQRKILVGRYSWAIPNARAIRIIAECSPVVEIGAGSGYWAHLVRLAGGEIRAFDHKPGNHTSTGTGEVWSQVERGGYERLPRDCGRVTLFLCWPPHSEPMAEESLRHFMQRGGRRLIYVGESRGGCTASDGFFDLLDEEFQMTDSESIPTWYRIHDSLSVFELKVR